MQKNREKVWKRATDIREDAADYFIPLGGYDDSTPAKREISNLTTTLYQHFPLVKSIVSASGALPVYVGYDGNDPETRSGTYTNNLILLHQDADDSSLAFIEAYCHELVHLDQDRRGLLRENAQPPPPEKMVDFLAHNLALEAAAYATEAVTLYYLSAHSKLRHQEPEVAGYFDEYRSQESRIMLGDIIEEALGDRDVKSFYDMKPAWQAVFQSFFEPDSAHLAHYLPEFVRAYLGRHTRISDNQKSHDSWGRERELRGITTMPGWGPMFSAQGTDILMRQIRASIVQQKYLGMIDVVRDHVAGMQRTEDIIMALIGRELNNNKKPPRQPGPGPAP